MWKNNSGRGSGASWLNTRNKNPAIYYRTLSCIVCGACNMKQRFSKLYFDHRNLFVRIAFVYSIILNANKQCILLLVKATFKSSGRVILTQHITTWISLALDILAKGNKSIKSSNNSVEPLFRYTVGHDTRIHRVLHQNVFTQQYHNKALYVVL